METVNAVKSTTVKTAFSRMMSECKTGPLANMIQMLGKNPVDVAVEQTLSTYAGQSIEMPDGSVILLSAENFELIVSSEAEKLAATANELIAEFATAAVPLLTQLRELRETAQKLLTETDERLKLPEYDDFEVKAGRRSSSGMGNGGAARKVRDWTSDVYLTPTENGAEKGWALLVRERDASGKPIKFGIMGPDGAESTTDYTSPNKAAEACCLLVNKKPGVNAMQFWGIPERAATAAEIESEEGVIDAA